MMDISWAQKLTKEELLSRFAKYLHKKGITWVSINTYKSDAFYIYRYDRNLFWDAFGSDNYADEIQKAFEKVLKVKGLRHQSGTDLGYRRAFDMFREFLEESTPNKDEQGLLKDTETSDKEDEKKKRPGAWDIYEAALLLDLYLRITRGEIKKKVGIDELSRNLRQRAINKGLEIDVAYRNESGIASQYYRMEYLFEEGDRTAKFLSDLFVNVFDLYHRNRIEYSKILNIAKEQVVREKEDVMSDDGEQSLKSMTESDVAVEMVLNKYDSLYCYLRDCDKYMVQLSFEELEAIFQNHLPANAYMSKGWWVNGGTQQAEAWLKAGYKVAGCFLQGRRSVLFVKREKHQQEQIKNNIAGIVDDEGIKQNAREEFKEILVDKFPKGFRLGPVDKRKFSDAYQERYGKDCIFDDFSMQKTLGEIAIDCGAKWYLPEQLVNDSLVNKIDEFIESTSAQGRKYIYYSFLQEQFKNDFLGTAMGDTEILKQYLRRKYIEKCCFHKDYFTIGFVKIDEKVEVRDFLEGKGLPLSSEEIISGLCHIPEGKIKQILGMNHEFVSNALNSWFAVSIVSFDTGDLDKFGRIIEDGIREKSYITKNVLYEKTKETLPNFLRNNNFLTPLGLRNTLKHFLKAQFNFNGAVICSKEEKLSSMDVLTEFAKSRKEFSSADLKDLADELAVDFVDGYYSVLFQSSVRVNKDKFVRKDLLNFNSEEIDEAIGRLMKRDYLPLKDFVPFIGFPYCGYPWNVFMLESYMANYSKKYCLLHASFGQDRVAGAVVRKHSGISDFTTLVVRALADSGVTLLETQALNWLVENGYMLRRSFKKFDSLLLQAETLREGNN